MVTRSRLPTGLRRLKTAALCLYVSRQGRREITVRGDHLFFRRLTMYLLGPLSRSWKDRFRIEPIEFYDLNMLATVTARRGRLVFSFMETNSTTRIIRMQP